MGSTNKYTFNQAIGYFEHYYMDASEAEKVFLKCWIYDCEVQVSGGRNPLPFNKYMRGKTYMYFLRMLKGYLVEVSDIGSMQEAIRHVNHYFEEGYNRAKVLPFPQK